MIKYNLKGEIILKTSYDLNIFENLVGAIIDGNCYIYFLGKIQGNFFLIKYDFDGKVLWEKKLEDYKNSEDYRFPLDSNCFAALFWEDLE